MPHFNLHTEVDSVIYDSGPVPDKSFFSPRGTSASVATLKLLIRIPSKHPDLPVVGLAEAAVYRGTSLIRNTPPVGPYSRTI